MAAALRAPQNQPQATGIPATHTAAAALVLSEPPAGRLSQCAARAAARTSKKCTCSESYRRAHPYLTKLAQAAQAATATMTAATARMARSSLSGITDMPAAAFIAILIALAPISASLILAIVIIFGE
jgi:hypothetical protein